MSRAVVHMGAYQPDLISGLGYSVLETYVITLRDRIRTALSGMNLKVGDIAGWQNGTSYGFAFAIRQVTGGTTPVGPEFLLIFGGNSVQAGINTDFYFDITTGNDYFRDWDDGSTDVLSSHANSWLFHYSPTAGLDSGGSPGADSYGMGYSNYLNMSYASEPTDPFTVKPHTSVDELMNTNNENKLYGICGANGILENNLDSEQQHWAIVFDDVKPFMAIYTTYGAVPVIRGAALLGKVCVPGSASDTDTNGTFTWDFTNDSQFMGTTAAHRGNVFNSSSVVTDAQTVEFTEFSYQNSRQPSGSNPANYLEAVLAGSTYTKGKFDPAIVRHQGVYNGEYLRQFAGPDGSFIKIGKSLVFPWVTSQPTFPPFKYELD